jgi:Autotransporter beta-domain
VSYAPNVRYKFDLPNTWFIEPEVGATYTQTFTANFGTQTGDSTEVHGGARFGFETLWNTVRVQPQLTLAAFSVVSQSIVAGANIPNGLPPGTPGAVATGTQTGQIGGRASGKLNFLWTDRFSSWVEAHGSTISGTDAYGASGGLRWTF